MQAARFYVMKKTGSLADSTAAAGVATILGRLADPAGDSPGPTITDTGPHFVVTLDAPLGLEDADYELLQLNPCYPYVKKGDDPRAPEFGQVIDYQAERDVFVAARKAKVARRAKDVSDIKETVQARKPRSDWYLYQNLNVLQAFGQSNSLHCAIRSSDLPAFGESVRAKLEALARGEDPASVETSFRHRVGPVQGFNPTVGKGVSELKPSGARVRNLGAQWADWFEEWTRYVGTWVVAASTPVGKDIKFLAVTPGDIRLTGLREAVRPELMSVSTLVWTSSHLDICSSLGVAKRLILGSGLLDAPAEWPIVGLTPRELVTGVQTAYFKSLGTGRAVANLSFIGVPGWFPVTDSSSAEAWRSIIDEHMALVRSLREDRSEQYELLATYRDFLSGQDLGALLLFLAGYACHLMRAISRGGRARRPVTENLRKVVTSMRQDYAKILDSPRFRHLALAMRLSTVAEQYHKARKAQLYEIHYSLYHDLRRAASFPEQLVKVIGDFVCSYNTENSRTAERAVGRPVARRRPNVTTADLEEVTRLIDEYGSEPVAYLLIGYASSREPREEAQAQSGQPDNAAVPN